MIYKKIGMLLAALALGITAVQAAGFTSVTIQKDTVEVGKKQDSDHKNHKKDDKKDGKKAGEKPSSYEQLLKKGGSVQEGLFTVRHIEDKWYFEVPDSLQGRLILAVTRLRAVPQNFSKFSGEAVNENTVYFEQRDEKTMLLRAYVLTQEAGQKDRISQTLKASTVDPIVASFPIIGKNKESGAKMIDVTTLFNKDNNVLTMPSATAKEWKLGSLQSDRTFIDTLKVYPINVEVVTTRTYSATPTKAPASSTGAMTIGLNTSMVLLPKVPMMKRLWDERVGYFTNRYTIFSDKQTKADHEAFISRFRLEPKDPKRYRKGLLTEPVKPIVFYIDPSTPKQWVPYLKAGIEDWNKAFEAAGFKNAIKAKDWPIDDPNMSLDDARYNVLLYLPAEIENAYGPRIVDPRSGEIIESHICWYHNVMNLLTKWYMIQCGPLDKAAQKMQFDEKLMGQLIRFVSSHEVGHTLGLRHNMGASHATPVEKLRDKAWVEAHGHTASIMDYARFNYVAQPEDGISTKGLFPRVNDYDAWAIKWGYQYRPEFKDPMTEKEQLMTETSKVLAANPRLWFGGEGRNEDPRAQTEDLGDDNVKASDYGIKNLKRVITNLPQWTKQTNDQHDDLLEMWKAAIGQFNRYTNHVLKNIGGRYLNNMPGKKPYEIAPAFKQKEAVDYFARQLFDAPVWLYPRNIVDLAGTNVTQEIGGMQQRVLKVMLSPTIMQKIYDAQSTQGAYQYADYLNDVFTAVWKPLNGQNGVKARTRRDLERTYVDIINNILNPVAKEKSKDAGVEAPLDVMLYMQQHLDKVENYCKAQADKAVGIDKLHYQDLLRQVKLIRDRQITIK